MPRVYKPLSYSRIACRQCGQMFQQKRNWNWYCSQRCKDSYNNAGKKVVVPPAVPLPTEPDYEIKTRNYPEIKDTTCSFCGLKFQATNQNQRYCSPAHRLAFYEAVRQGRITEDYKCPSLDSTKSK